MGYSNVSGLAGNCVVIKSDVGNVRIPSVVYSIQQNIYHGDLTLLDRQEIWQIDQVRT